MRPQVIAQTDVGTTVWIPVNTKQTPVNIGLGCVVSGTPTYNIEHTFDDVLGGASAVAFPHATLTAKTANADGSYLFPVSAIRINITAGTGTVTLTILQGF